MNSTKTALLAVQNSTQTSLRVSPVRYDAPWPSITFAGSVRKRNDTQHNHIQHKTVKTNVMLNLAVLLFAIMLIVVVRHVRAYQVPIL